MQTETEQSTHQNNQIESLGDRISKETLVFHSFTYLFVSSLLFRPNLGFDSTTLIISPNQKRKFADPGFHCYRLNVDDKQSIIQTILENSEPGKFSLSISLLRDYRICLKYTYPLSLAFGLNFSSRCRY